MTSLTAQLRGDVCRRFDNIVSGQPQATGVATGTVLWRALEDGIDVTRLATCRRVNAGQRKPGLQVVKLGGGPLRMRRGPGHGKG